MDPLSLRSVVTVIEEKCVNCHRCIAVCPVKMCNDGSGSSVKINSALCLGCGECISACTHQARIGLDDADAFFEDLKNGEKIIAISAPATAAQNGSYLKLNGWLSSIGVKAVFDVAFGAELTVKSYLEHQQKDNPLCTIAQPCPAIVNFIELYRPELFSLLAPVDSPMVHTMKMIREFFPEYNDYKIAAISPCYAKRREFDATGYGDYNVTLRSIDTYLKKNNIDLESFPQKEFQGPLGERAVLFSAPGGLTRTAERYNSHINEITRRIEGKAVHGYLAHLGKTVRQGIPPVYKLIDCLNCEMGCNAGAGTLNQNVPIDAVETSVEKRNQEMQEFYRNLGLFKTKEQQRKNIDALVEKYWKPGLYERKYVDRSALFGSIIKKPNNEEIQKVNIETHKDNPMDILNCGSCGYKSCEQMAVAIFNKLNKAENCRHYVSVEVKLMHEKHLKEVENSVHAVIASSSLRMEESIQKINELTDEADGMMNSVGRSSIAIKQMVSHLKQINDVLLNTEKAVSELEEAASEGSRELGGIVELMNDISTRSDALIEASRIIQKISSQTNLLSMNAAIEAAHAGGVGGGFAVVADEIRVLAVNSSSQAKSISSVLREIKDLIDRTNGSSQNVQKGFEQVVQLTTQVKDEEGHIREVVGIQNSSGKQVLSALEQINDITGKVRGDADELLKFSNEILEDIKHI